MAVAPHGVFAIGGSAAVEERLLRQQYKWLLRVLTSEDCSFGRFHLFICSTNMHSASLAA